MDYQQFATGIPARFLELPIYRYSFAIEFMEITPDAQTVLALRNRVAAAAVAVVQDHPYCNLSALKFSTSEDNLVGLFFGNPVYDFAVTIRSRLMTIDKQNCSAEEFVLTLPLLVDLATRLFSKSSVTSLREFSFFDWIYRIGHRFWFELRVGSRLSDETKLATSHDVASWFGRLDEDDQHSIISLIQPERLMRVDAMHSVIKEIQGRRRSIYMNVEAPWNVTQRDVNLSFSVFSGEPGTDPIVEDELTCLEPMVMTLYREFVLRRLFPEILADMQVVGRP